MTKSSVAVACLLPGRAKDLTALLYFTQNWLNCRGLGRRQPTPDSKSTTSPTCRN